MKFIHLHTHSAFSLGEGAIKLPELADLCIKFDMPAVAVTDTGNMFGGLQFSNVMAKSSGIQPIVGCQMWIERPEQVDAKNKEVETPDQIVLLAKDEEGYMNLMKLTSHGYVASIEHANKPAISWADLKAHSKGLICLTGSIVGSFGRLLVEHQVPAAEKLLLELKETFGDRLYIELQRHGLPQENEIEDKQLDFAYEHNIPIVATNDCYYPHPEMYAAHDAFLCIAEGTYVQEDNRRKVTKEHYFKSQEQMIELFKDLPEAIENTVNIAKRCAFKIFEREPLLPNSDTKEGNSENDEFREQSQEGLDWRLEKYVFQLDWDDAKKEEIRKEYQERLDYEVGVIVDMGFPGYFLIVADFIRWAKEHDIPVGPGRGSGAGSVVAWALKITDLDPIEWSLLFERFLNPDRVSMPDFDIDFCQERREEVIHYVRDKYGADSVAQIITFGKLQARAVVRDVGRVLQVPYMQVDKIAKLIPGAPGSNVTLSQAIDSEVDLRIARDDNEQIKSLLDVALQLEGLYRHAGTHAAGVVIGDRPLDELVPLYQDPSSEMAATQFNMKDVEKAGLVKFDFLGLRNLTLIQDATKFIKETTGQELDPLDFPMDDPESYEILARGECTSVFQLESAGMRDLCRKIGVKNFEDAAAVIALFRPGPMENIPLYLENVKDPENVTYMHPLLEPILKDTYGVMIYQEQVMSAAQVLAGYSLGGADLLRRAMGKKIKEEMDAQRSVFVDGCLEHNQIENELAESIFDMIAQFASYGFNKAHTAGYAYIAFQTAYLKAHYPVEFMAAALINDSNNTERLAILRQEVVRMEIELLPPDVNYSYPRFSVEQMEDGTKAIRYALGALKGVGEAAMQSVVDEREANGKYKDIYDFAKRVDSKAINKRQMESLVKAGAFDNMNDNRAQLLASCGMLLKYSHAVDEEKNSDQNSLFGGDSDDGGLPAPKLEVAKKFDPLERLRNEFEAIGFYLSAHPLDNMTTQLKRLRVVSLAEVKSALRKSPSKRLKMAGIVVRKVEKISQKGNKFAFVQISDATGVYEMTLFSDLLSASRDLLVAGTPILVSVDVDMKDEEDLRFLGQTIDSLTDAVHTVTRRVEVVVSDKDVNVKAIKDVVEKSGKGRVKTSILLDTGQYDIEIELAGGYVLPEESVKELRQVDGVLEVAEL